MSEPVWQTPELPVPKEVAGTGARVTVMETIAYQSEELGTLVSGKPYSFYVSSDQDPYQRRVKIDEQWTRIDLGGIICPALIHIVNESNESDLLITYAEEQSTVATTTIGLLLRVCPGRSQHLSPDRANCLWLRCTSGKCRANILVIPK